MMMNDILSNLDIMIKNPKCELNYNNDYELLIATILSAQCTDKTVNKVTSILFNKYDIHSLANANYKDIESIIKPCGTHNKKSKYIVEVAKRLVNDYNGLVPNDRKYLESLPGVGRKTTNVVLSNIYNVEALAVDTHVERVSKRLGLVKKDDNVLTIEKKLMKKIPKSRWIKTHHQLVLFGRYICKAKNPQCDNCLITNYCKYYKEIK